MSVVPATEELSGHRRIRDWLGDRIMFGLTLVAALATVAIMVLIAYKVVRGASLSYRAFGLSFVTSSVWDVNKAVFGAAPVHLRHGRHLADGAADRGAARDRDRALPERARAARRAR